jgi:hypothetical protein
MLLDLELGKEPHQSVWLAKFDDRQQDLDSKKERDE